MTELMTRRTAFLIAVVSVWLVASWGQSRRTPQQAARRPVSQVNARAEALRLNNLGAAYMGQQRFQRALALFQRAAQLDPSLRSARLNQGIALLNLQQFATARSILEKASQENPQDARAWYNLGLLLKNQGEALRALEAFAKAAQLAPDDADAQYFLGTLYAQSQQDAKAVAAFEQALRLNPFHVSAEFGLARAYQHSGNAEKARLHLARFQELQQNKLGAPISLAYGDQGPLSLAEQSRAAAQSVPAPIRVRFSDVTAAAGLPDPLSERGAYESHSVASCWLDYDGDGRPDLLIAAPLRLYHNLGNGRFMDVTRSADLDPDVQAESCAAADYDNDGRPDFALGSGDGVSMLHNQGGIFKDMTASDGIEHKGSAASLTFWDYDHDGDADLFVSNGFGNTPQPVGADGNTLWRNNGNGTFTRWTAESGLPQSGAVAAIASDLNNDRAVDLIVAGKKTQIFLNPREGKWAASEPWASPMPGATTGIAVLDFNKDGWMDLALTHVVAPGLTLWRNLEGKKFERVRLPDLGWTGGSSVAALDYDNDGWIDLIAVGQPAGGRSELRLLRNEGAHGFRDVSDDVGIGKLDLGAQATVTTADYDSDGDTDLLVASENGRPILLRNDGGNRNHSLRIALKGLNDNKSGLGTKVEVFAGDLWQKWELASGGGPGQSYLEIVAGLGQRAQADVVRMLWPTGVVQDEVELAAGKRTAITEIDRRGSSCPVLFVWDGRRYRFVADMIGAGVVGHWIAPGERNVADPTEYVKLDSAPQLRNGRLSFRLMEPMEEVVYLDQVRLLAVDHPADAEVYPNEYFASNPPFPQFKVIAVRDPQPVAAALDDHRRDVTESLRARDRRYVSDFELLPFKGFTRPHTLELDLGGPYRGGPLRLLLHGYIEYFTATSMFAAAQAGLAPVAPFAEAQDASGNWVRILDDMGFPAGLARTITVDLSERMPRGARRIRITTNLQIYWDEVLVDRTAANLPVRTHDVPLSAARLAFHGFPRAVEHGEPGDLSYVYEDVSLTGPYARPMGAYTRHGDVRTLLAQSDDRFAVFGSGDEVQLEFDPGNLPPLASGWKRDWFFFADGYEKDMDFYAANFLTVDPLPFHAMGLYPPVSRQFPDDAEHLDYRLNSNTRFYSQRDAGEYRFRYRPSR